MENNGNLSLQLYVKQAAVENEHNTEDLIDDIKTGQQKSILHWKIYLLNLKILV